MTASEWIVCRACGRRSYIDASVCGVIRACQMQHHACISACHERVQLLADYTSSFSLFFFPFSPWFIPVKCIFTSDAERCGTVRRRAARHRVRYMNESLLLLHPTIRIARMLPHAWLPQTINVLVSLSFQVCDGYSMTLVVGLITWGHSGPLCHALSLLLLLLSWTSHAACTIAIAGVRLATPGDWQCNCGSQ